LVVGNGSDFKFVDLNKPFVCGLRRPRTLMEIVFYSKSKEGKAFVHANCVFVHEAELNGRCNSSERKRPYSRVLYLVLFDTSVESESVTLYPKF
jgi:hypothetical protein